MPAVDLVELIRKLPPDSALCRAESDNWGPVDENAARMLDIEAFRVELEWADRHADPEDRELQRERALAKRDGIKPPPHPIIPPVAARPPRVAMQRWQEYHAEVEKYQLDSGPQFVTLDEFDEALEVVEERI